MSSERIELDLPDGYGGSITVVISGQVATYADLPVASLHLNEIYYVHTTTGTVGVDRKNKGYYKSTGITWEPWELDDYAIDQLNKHIELTVNSPITPGTATKVTFDSKGFITVGTNATTADIADSTNKRYVSDAQLSVLGNTSGTNSGDQIAATIDTNQTGQTVQDQLDYLQGEIITKQDALGFTPENVANKENGTLDSSTTKYPTNNLIKTYVDTERKYVSVGVYGNEPTFTDNGNGTVNLGSFDILLKSTVDGLSNIEKYTVAASGPHSFTDGAAEYLYVSYNGGSPVVAVTADYTQFDEATKVPIFKCWRNGTTVHSLSGDAAGVALANKLATCLTATLPYRRAGESGLIISETISPVPRTIDVTQSYVYAGTFAQLVNPYTSATHTFTKATVASSVWTYDSSVSFYDNSNYNPVTGVVAMDVNKWSTRWFYRSIGDVREVFYVLGEAQHNKRADAELEQPRTDLPSLIKQHCVLIGRSVIQAGATSGFMTSAFDIKYAGSVIEHNETSNIQGGAVGQYYHLDSPQYIVVTNTSGVNTGDQTAATVDTNQTGQSVQDQLDYLQGEIITKQDALGFTPENVSNKENGTLDTSTTKYPTNRLVKEYVDGIIGNANALVYKGTINCSGNPNYPAADAGHTYIVSALGKIGGASGESVHVGDLIICNTDSTVSGNQATVGTYWNVVESNIITDVDLITQDTYFTTGIVNRQNLSLSFDTSTKILSVTSSSGFVEFYLSGIKYTKASPQTVDIDSVVGSWTNNKLYFVFFNSSGVLTAQDSAWTIDSSNAPVATVFWNGTAATAIIGNEFHNATRNLAWHTWAHQTIGTRWKSGLAGTFTSSTTSIDTGIIEDEDLILTISPQTQVRLIYDAVGGATITYNDTLSNTAAFIDTGALKYVTTAGTITSVTSGNYVRNFIYATNDVNTPIVCLVGENEWSNINDARVAPFPVPPSYVSSEIRLLYSVIWQNVGGTPTYVEATDFRSAPTQPNGELANRPIFLDELADVTVPTPSLDQVLRWNGSAWTNGTPATSSASNGISFFSASPAIFDTLNTPTVNQRRLSSYSKTPNISQSVTGATVSAATPSLVTKNGHNLSPGTAFTFDVGGTLPTGVTAGTTYYVLLNAAYTANAFNFSATLGGAAVNGTGSPGTSNITTSTIGTQFSTIATANTVAFGRAFLYNTALGRTSIDAGVWDFTIYAGVSSVGNGRVNTIKAGIYQVIEPIGTLSTATGTTTRVATAATATPFLSTDATADLSTCSYLQTPTGLFEITGYTSTSVVTVTCLASYVDETNIASGSWKLWRRLFGINSPAVTSITPAVQTLTISSAQPAFSIGITDKLGQIITASNTTNNSTTFTYYYDGSVSNSSTKTPLITLHNNLAGLQGGSANEYYHLTSAQHTVATNTSGTNSGDNTFTNGLTESVKTVSNDLITGKVGGQTVIGGTAANNNLQLQSTSSETRGEVQSVDDFRVLVGKNLKVGTYLGASGSIRMADGTIEIYGLDNSTGGGGMYYYFDVDGTDGSLQLSTNSESFWFHPSGKFDTGSILAYDGTNQIQLGWSNVTTITCPNPAAPRAYTIPDAGADASFVMTQGNQTITGVKTFNTAPAYDASILEQAKANLQIQRDTWIAAALMS